MDALPSKSLQYFVAIAATAVALAARFMLESALGHVAPFIIFTLSVVVVAWYGGLGPGILATALGAVLGSYYFIEPIHSLRIHRGAGGVEEVLFLGIGVSISALSQARLTLEARRRQLLISEQEARRAA